MINIREPFIGWEEGRKKRGWELRFINALLVASIYCSWEFETLVV